MELDWDLIWIVERNICFLYHEHATLAGIDGDLGYAGLYDPPYWNYLDARVRQMPEVERAFFQGGCLIMILAMAKDLMEGSGAHLSAHLDDCQQAVTEMTPQDGEVAELQRIVLLALQTARMGVRATEELQRLTVWVNRTFIQGYFRSRVTESVSAHRRILR